MKLSPLTMVLCGLIACQAAYADAFERQHQAATKEVVKSIAADEILERMDDSMRPAFGFFLVDLRTEADFRQSSIPGSINIPYKKLPFVAEKVFTKADDIAFFGYPDNDVVSENAVIFMRNKGYPNCVVFRDALRSWPAYMQRAVDVGSA